MKPILRSFLICLFLISISTSQLFSQSIPYGDNKETGKYIQLNGVRHYYETYGKGAPMLLIHGNGTGIKGWAAQIDYFSKKYTVYAIDCRGRGKSDLGGDTLTYMQQAKDMNAFIKALQLDSVSVVGKSDGGIIAILMGIYYPERLKKIVAFGANMQPDTTALYPQVVADIREERQEADRKLAAKDTTKNWRLVQQRNRMMEFQPHITAQELAKIKIPVLVLSCDRDVIKEEHTLFIYKSIPNASLGILPGETHYIPRVHPELFNATVDGFLSRPFKGKSFENRQPPN